MSPTRDGTVRQAGVGVGAIVGVGVGVSVGVGVGVTVGVGVGVGAGVAVGVGVGVAGSVGAGVGFGVTGRPVVCWPPAAMSGCRLEVPAGMDVATVATAVGSADASTVPVALSDGDGCIDRSASVLAAPDETAVAPSTPPVGRDALPTLSANTKAATKRAATIGARRSMRRRIAAGRLTGVIPAAATAARGYATAQAGQAPAASIQHQRQAYTPHDAQ